MDNISKKERIRQRQHEYYITHKAQILEAQKRYRERDPIAYAEMRKKTLKKYYEKNKEKILGYSREWHYKNRDHRLSQQAEWRATHKEHINEHAKVYRKATNERARRYLKDRRKKKIGWAHNMVAYYKGKGILAPQPCEICGAEPTEAHHCDYNKPLEIMWLCKKHHAEWHKNNKPIYIREEKKMVNDNLKEYELKIKYSDDISREPIDLMLLDTNNDETYATLFGSEPWHDYDWTCDHPTHLIEYDDDETVGTCPICGATCDWHWAKDFDGDTNIAYREPHEWYHPKEPKGIIGHILENIRKDF